MDVSVAKAKSCRAWACAPGRMGAGAAAPVALRLSLVGVFYGVEGGMLLKGSNMLFASGVLASINTLFGIWCLAGVIRGASSDWRPALAGLRAMTGSSQDSAVPSWIYFA